MKGIVFTELLDMVEDKFGAKTLDNVVRKANLPHNAIYISGGNYPFEELQSLVVALSEETKTEPNTLLHVFGHHLFTRLIAKHPYVLMGKTNPLDFIASVHEYIHVEVRKLYPDADLPYFEAREQGPEHLVIAYRSEKRLEAFAEGMMIGCGEYYKQPLAVKYETVNEGSEHTVLFNIRLLPKTETHQLQPKSRNTWSRLVSWFRG